MILTHIVAFKFLGGASNNAVAVSNAHIGGSWHERRYGEPDVERRTDEIDKLIQRQEEKTRQRRAKKRSQPEQVEQAARSPVEQPFEAREPGLTPETVTETQMQLAMAEALARGAEGASEEELLLMLMLAA